MSWSPADLAAVRFAGRSLRTRRNKLLWARDPVAWVHDRLGEDTWSKQDEILTSVAENPRTAVPSCHGVGKSHIASRTGLWWVDTAERPEDRFLVTTAPTWSQVKAILWRYMRQGWQEHKLVGTILQNAEWKAADGELVGYGRKPADHDESAFQGIHAPDGVLVVIDEACGVPKQLFVAADALATNDTSRVLGIGNPDDNSAHFARVCSTEPGWNVIRISALDSPNLTGEPVSARMRKSLVTRWWVEDKRIRWGEHNPLYQAKVLGLFADSEDGLIPMSWIRQAQYRWHAWQEQREASPVIIEPPGRRVYGVDVARFGEDKTAIAVRQGSIVNPDGQKTIETHAKIDTVTLADIVAAKLAAHPQSTAQIDLGGGHGAGVYDILSRKGYDVQAFNGSAATKMRDTTSEWKFPNVRSASWWHLRELLDPAHAATLALPEDDDLTAELTTPKWDVRAGGVLVVEEKDDIKARLGRSPDVGDAVVMSVWIDSPARADDSDAAPAPARHADAYEPDIPHNSGGAGLVEWTEEDEEEAEVLQF